MEAADELDDGLTLEAITRTVEAVRMRAWGNPKAAEQQRALAGAALTNWMAARRQSARTGGEGA
jgi:hypothetical protein